MNQNSRIAHFPISFFATVMGLSGLTLAWEKTQHIYALDLPISLVLTSITVIVFMLLLLTYVSSSYIIATKYKRNSGIL